MPPGAGITTALQYRNLSPRVSSLQAAPDPAEHVELLVGEVHDEVAADAVEVGAAGRGELRAAGCGQDGEGAARVALARLALEEPLASEPVDQAGQAAAAEQDRRRQIVHPHPALGGVGEVHEDLVRGHAQAVGGLELRVERLDEVRVRSEEHTSELQSLTNLVCRLLLEKKKKNNNNITGTSSTKTRDARLLNNTILRLPTRNDAQHTLTESSRALHTPNDRVRRTSMISR